MATGRNDEAIRQYGNMLEANMMHSYATMRLAGCYVAKGCSTAPSLAFKA